MFLAMPTPMRVWALRWSTEAPCPVTVREGRQLAGSLCARNIRLRPLPRAEAQSPVGEVRLLTAGGGVVPL